MAVMNKILMIGAGAIGGITAAYIKKAGYDITIITKYREVAQSIASEGIHIRGIRGSIQVVMPAYASFADMTMQKFDLVFHSTKVTDLAAALEGIEPFLHECTLVVSMQNGLSEYSLDRILSGSRVVGCVVGWGATLLSPGDLEMTSEGEFVIGNILINKDEPMSAFIDESLPEIRDILNCVVPTSISKNILGELYAKLIINSCITSLGALSGLTLGTMLSRRKFRNIFMEIMREAIPVAQKMNISVAVYAGKINFYQWASRTSLLGQWMNHLSIYIIGLKYRRLRSSMLQSLERGKLTEIDALNGFLVSEGRKVGLAVPVNEAIVRMIHEIEKGQRQPGLKNFDEPPFGG